MFDLNSSPYVCFGFYGPKYIHINSSTQFHGRTLYRCHVECYLCYLCLVCMDWQFVFTFRFTKTLSVLQGNITQRNYTTEIFWLISYHRRMGNKKLRWQKQHNQFQYPFFGCATSHLPHFLPFVSTAHSGRKRRWRTVPVLTRLMPGGLPHVAIHRVQRCQGHMPLLCQQAQFLAHLPRSVVPQSTCVRDA